MSGGANGNRGRGPPPSIIQLFYERLMAQHRCSNDIMEALGLLIQDQDELKRAVADLQLDFGQNRRDQDERLLANEESMRALQAQLEELKPRGGMASSVWRPLTPAASPGTRPSTARSTARTQIRVSCPMCGKDLAKGSLKNHMTTMACRKGRAAFQKQ